MSTRNLTLNEQAFVGMITAAIETYKKETFGLLLGSIHKKHFMATDAIAFQAAQRDYDFVQVRARDVNRINYALEHISEHRLIGDFHSHPDFPERLSKHDKWAFRISGTPLAVVVVVKKTAKHIKWQRNEDMSISGTIGKKWFIKVLAYEYVKKDDRIYQIKIVCPYLKTVNKLLQKAKRKKR